MTDTKTMRRLKDFNGYHVWKEQTVDGKYYYYLCEPEEDEIINVYSTLAELKADA